MQIIACAEIHIHVFSLNPVGMVAIQGTALDLALSVKRWQAVHPTYLPNPACHLFLCLVSLEATFCRLRVI